MDLGLHNDFLNISPKQKQQKKKLDKLALVMQNENPFCIKRHNQGPRGRKGLPQSGRKHWQIVYPVRV